MSSATIRSFGEFRGTDIQEITLRSQAGAEARILTYGAVIRDLVVPTAAGPQPVCLGLNSMADYQAHSPHFGAVPGRVANRIAGGRFTLDGKTYTVPRNEGGLNCLHGGDAGFGLRPWRVAEATQDSVTLTLASPDGDAGFPGAVEVTCLYRLIEPATLRYELHATTDAPTVVNLTNHAYFNLDGSPDILDHELTIHAGRITLLDKHLIPTGEIAPVDATPYDFRQPRPIRHPSGQAYDMNFVVEGGGTGTLVHAARARSPKNGLTLDVYSDQPGVQLYDAAKLNCPVPGLGAAHYGPRSGFCLETQLFPDAPNQPNFPSSVLRPGERYANITEFRFG